MIMQPVVSLFNPGLAQKHGVLKELFRRLDLRRFMRAVEKPVAARSRFDRHADPHLLLLLADQELIEGREEQARYLVEAAYEFFDRKAKTNVYRFNLAG